MEFRNVIKLGSALLILVVASLITRSIILAPIIHLQPAPDLTGAVAQAIILPGSNPEMPQYGDYFTVDDVHYLSHTQWVVLTVDSAKDNFDPGTLVMKKVDGAYQKVLGPSAQFSTSYKITLPKDVGAYLDAIGVLHG